MKERPILFNGQMVRAILMGLKTQTRRIIYPQPALKFPRPFFTSLTGHLKYGAINGRLTKTCSEHDIGLVWLDRKETEQQILSGEIRCGLNMCPYGQIGDRLWVRETFQGPILDDAQIEQFHANGPDAFRNPEYCVYRATDTLDAVDEDGKDLCWRPSIHMPRWASRITLEIVSVRVERLQDISDVDAIAEGTPGGYGAIPGYAYNATPCEQYRWLWENINGPGSWDANHWVWVVEFKRVENAK